MDGERNKKENQARNKHCSNPKSNSVQNVGSHNSNNIQSPQSPSSLNVQEEGASGGACGQDHNQQRCLVASREESSTSSQALSLSRDPRHSLSAIGTANGASSGSAYTNSVVKASSTGTLSVSQSQFHLKTDNGGNSGAGKRDSTASSTIADFLASFPNSLTCSGASLPGHSSTTFNGLACSANAGKTANGGGSDADSVNSGPVFFPPLLPVPQPQNQAIYNWQAGKTNVKDRLAYLYNTDTMTDIQFKVLFMVIKTVEISNHFLTPLCRCYFFFNCSCIIFIQS